MTKGNKINYIAGSPGRTELSYGPITDSLLQVKLFWTLAGFISERTNLHSVSTRPHPHRTPGIVYVGVHPEYTIVDTSFPCLLLRAKWSSNDNEKSRVRFNRRIVIDSACIRRAYTLIMSKCLYLSSFLLGFEKAFDLRVHETTVIAFAARSKSSASSAVNEHTDTAMWEG